MAPDRFPMQAEHSGLEGWYQHQCEHTVPGQLEAPADMVVASALKEIAAGLTYLWGKRAAQIGVPSGAAYGIFSEGDDSP